MPENCRALLLSTNPVHATLIITPQRGYERSLKMHHHPHEYTENVIHRLSRAIGHLESVKTMVQDGRDCSEILIQIAAVKSAVNNIGKVILKDHINHCVVEAVETGDHKTLEDLNTAIDRFMK